MKHLTLGCIVRLIARASGVLVAASSPAPGQTTNASLVLRGATIYTAPDNPRIADGVVIIRDGKIAAVGRRSEIPAPAGMPVLELTGLVLVPGFWNSHVHFSGTQWAGADTAAPARLAESVRAMLTRWGFTTVFDTGSELENTLALKRRIEAGAVDGPKIFTTGDILFPVGAPLPVGAPRVRFRVAAPNEAVAATTTLLDGGADAIKVYAQAFWDLSLKLSPDVLAAVVAEAHRRNVQVFAHPSNRDGLYNAVGAGVDVLVHTTPQIGPWGNELVARMKASNIALIPTLKLWRFEGVRERVPAPDIEAFQRRGIAQLREYHSAGGAILFGTDVGYMTDFSTLEEFQKMSEAGMGFRDILASLTVTPAARRGLGASTGKVAVGFDGDLVVLGSDPARSVDAFADVAYTIRAGRVIYRSTRH